VYKNGVFYHGAVLWQQGKEACGQPVESDDVVLLFNGDLYDCSKKDDRSDTEFLFEAITGADTEDELLEVFRKVSGPFSIICWHKSKIYFARDSLGRNSLIIGRGGEAVFLSSVVAPENEELEAMELPPLGVFSVDVSSKEFSLFPYQNLKHQHHLDQLELLNRIVPVRILRNAEPNWQLQVKSSPAYSFDELCRDLNDENIFELLLEVPEVLKTCGTFLELLSASVEDRTSKTQKKCKNCLYSGTACYHSHIGILFSGGVDCSMVSVIADKFIDPCRPIDLMNVAFEKVSYSNKKTEINWDVPDRLTGRETLNELQRLCPDRTWNFVEINVTRQELKENLPKLSSLVFPLSNVLDESLGAALYFASRGAGILDETPYSSPCRVILIGSGADELFGGYTRHRNAFKRSPPDRDMLKEELDLDWVRLPSRNLARDDRVIGDHGITVRAPFIEEKFVNFVQQLKPLQRCLPSLPGGVGDKLLLRLCAHHLGLKNCSTFRKRALQFGSRIADKRQSAKDTSTLLTSGK
jgi:asparagine synthetase B (glutamine-hydrolysing)